MKRTIVIALLVLLLPAYPARAAGTASGKLNSLQRVLEATHYVENFKQGIRQVVKDSRSGSPSLSAILTTDNAKLEKIFARIYARHLSSAQVDKLVGFYESPIGRTLIEREMQEPNNPNPQLGLTPAQRDKLDSFNNSDASRAFATVVRDPKIMDELNRALKSSLPR